MGEKRVCRIDDPIDIYQLTREISYKTGAYESRRRPIVQLSRMIVK